MKLKVSLYITTLNCMEDFYQNIIDKDQALKKIRNFFSNQEIDLNPFLDAITILLLKQNKLATDEIDLLINSFFDEYN